MATEYIEKQKAIDNIEKSFDKETILNRFIRKIAISAVRRMEPADVRPVVRGKWLYEDSASNYLAYKCSVCGTGGRLHKFSFCSQCGADMRGGDAG